MANYYVKRDGKLYGPFSVEQIAQCINTDIFTMKDVVSENQINWITLDEFQKKQNIVNQVQPQANLQAALLASPVNAGYPPQPNAGYQPQPNAGYQPQPNAGYQPQPNAGYQPQPNAGYQPQPNAGYQPQPNPQVYYNNNDVPANAKSRRIYILLALFLGGFGIHDFYAGYTGKGIAKLILTCLCFAYISWIWALIDIKKVTFDSRGIAMAEPRANQIIYVLLGIFGGTFGYHLIYTGFISKGFKRLGVGWVFSFISYLAVPLLQVSEKVALAFMLGAGVGLFILFICAIIDLFTVKTDSLGQPFA